MNESSEQSRMVIFVLLTLAVILIWSHFFKPPAPPPKPRETAQKAAPAQAGKATLPAAPSKPAKAVKIPAVSAQKEEGVTVDSPLYEVELSNRGAAVRSWRLKKYLDDQKPPKPLDLVNSDASQQLGWPFTLLLADPKLQQEANSALYEMTPAGGHLTAPAEITFHWSDGHLDVTKKLAFTAEYELSVDASVSLDGKPLPFAIAWRGGFGDKAVANASKIVNVFYHENGSLETIKYSKLGLSANRSEPAQQSGPLEFAGIQDTYFAAAFIPEGPGFSLWDWSQEHEFTAGGKDQKETIAEVAGGTTAAAALRMKVYVGPKDLSVLNRQKPPLGDLVSFGWTSVIAKPLLYALKWVHSYVPNYGWAIVLLTLAINIPLFPLKVMSQRSMQRMQVVAPEMRAIQDRYKKYSFSDPRKRKMNEEIMELYQKHGINPLPIGTCLPMLLQLPIWWALDRVLMYSIELRHAPWFGWIHDLSVKDPWYIIPIAMTFGMYWMTKMTPQVASVDPAQQKMMKWMPIFMGLLFFDFSSGLNLYVLTSSMVGAGQQYYLNRTRPMPSRSKFKNKKKAS